MRIAIAIVTSFFFGMHAFLAEAQKEVDQDWNGFSQKLDVQAYTRGKFRLKAFVRIENGDKDSQARLWARVDKKKSIGFFDNMTKRPITSSDWTEYTIDGDIDQEAQVLIIGGLIFGFEKCYYDHFTLEIQKENSVWEHIQINNGDFESTPMDGWRQLYNVKGYEFALTTTEGLHGTQALVIDGRKRSSQSFGSNKEIGEFQEANGIRIYYEEYGSGEPLLLVHGNGESIASFKYQIPELSKTFRVIAMDSRGQGHSTEDGTKLTYELMAEDVQDFLNKKQLTNINVLGWSDGGNIGLVLAMKHPEKVKKLAIMGANLYNDKTSVDQNINKSFIAARGEIAKNGGTDAKFKLQLIDLALHEPNINPDQLKSITCSTLVMAGSKDVIKEAHTKLIASKIEKSKLVIFDKGTHYEPQENPERFNKTVLGFFTEN